MGDRFGDGDQNGAVLQSHHLMRNTGRQSGQFMWAEVKPFALGGESDVAIEYEDADRAGGRVIRQTCSRFQSHQQERESWITYQRERVASIFREGRVPSEAGELIRG